jgi:hypothetical protein
MFDYGFCGVVDIILGSATGEIVGEVYSSEVKVEDLL